jgi:molybdopterin-containing oxidoreductase family membrane subunit
MAIAADSIARPQSSAEIPEDLREHLMLDPRPRGEMNSMVMESMHTTSKKFWGIVIFLVLTVLFALFGAWGLMISQGMGLTGLTRPVYWGIFIVDVVFWIGISHAGTFISALLRVMKYETRRPFTRAAELMTTFGLLQAAISIFMHLGRVWLAYWLVPYPNERTIWPNFHSPLMWDFMAINTYVIASTMYLFLPLIPDLAMARDRSGGWRKTFYRIIALGFRGTETEWRHLKSAMNIFAFAIIPVMFSVHTVVSWDFAMATRPGWASSIFGPYFVIGALQSGIAAVLIVIFIIRSTMKNMKYFLRPEHFDFLGKLSLIVSMAWAYFFFNDYIVPWYGGDKFEKLLLDFQQHGPFAYVWVSMLICNVVIPWAILWNKKWRRTPWLMMLVGIVIVVGMWIERFVIIPISLTITRMPFTWRLYKPNIEIPMTIGTFALFLLLYMIASRLIPLVPVWEVQEGQAAHLVRKVGKASIPTVGELD